MRRGLPSAPELLEAVLADSYGPASLTREGRLPAALIAGNPEYLRPLVGVAPPGGAHLRFYAVDVGRGADGRWWVLGDRAQAPSGAGYAIENRLALSRAIPDIYRTTRVERVAPFFQAFQAELFALNRQDDARICLLTPGPMNETYFEHAYLARYLGLLLVDGEDLIVREDGVFIRTVAGLRRTEVLLRRIDADFADPLELNAASHLGVAGLIQAVRDDKIVIINSLGAGLVEARALLAFLPALAPIVLGAELKMPNVATWWLGRADVREQMIEKLGDMVIAAAFTESMAGMRLTSEVLGAKLDDAQRGELVRSIRDRGIDYVVQEAVTLSSMPVWREGRLQPRPFTLRLFLAKVGDRWQVMPGGFVRIAEHADARAVSLQRGGARPMRGCSPTALSARRRCCRIRSGCRYNAPRDSCQAGPPIICSGLADTSNAPRRRCGSFARSSTGSPRQTMQQYRSYPVSARCSPPGVRFRKISIGRRPLSWRAPRSRMRTWKDRCRASRVPRAPLLR